MDVIAVVTGASRGAGKGIAIALGETGATVYVTGRSTADGDSPYGGTVTETADLITRSGGKGVAIALDHTDDEVVAALFARVKAEHGRLDILVNNAANAVESTTMPGASGKSRWRRSISLPSACVRISCPLIMLLLS